jgi:hypothetical protein
MSAIEAAVARVEAAFRDAAHPGADRLVAPSEPPDLEGQAAARDFGERHWRDLDAAFLSEHAAALALLSAEGYAFYLPAYLVAMLAEPIESDLVPTMVLVTLTPADEPRSPTWLAERLALLDREQRAAVRDAITVAADEYAGIVPREAAARARAFWDSLIEGEQRPGP